METKNLWLKYDQVTIDACMAFNEDYKTFISDNKTEREFVKGSIALLKEAGFKDLNDCIANQTPLKAGDKVYANNKGKMINCFVIGSEDIERGMNILGAHIDSPRIDVKQRPLYEDHELCLLKSHYYGGIKKYQWVAIPLTLKGVVCKKDGTVVEVSVGDDENDPVLGISDLLIHLAGEQMKKTAAEVIRGEDLNLMLGSMPGKDCEKDEKEATKKAILNILKDKYGIEEDDFISAELEIVPNGKARDYGLDRSMVIGYGHDDKVCAYTSLRALLDVQPGTRTYCACLVDKEEVGSIGATGMHSLAFENQVAEICALMGKDNFLAVRHVLANSKMLSSDVSAAFDPNYAAVNDMFNTCFLGHGIVFNKYTGSRGKGGCNDANGEYIAQLRNVMDSKEIGYQTSELGAVDVGGGGTIAYICAQYNMEVIDAGVAVQNMHAPYEVVSKADVFETYRAYKVFLEDMR